MDTSETYRRMCDYGEIQKARPITIGGFYANRNAFGYRVIGSDSLPTLTEAIFLGDCIWLPTQSQLQEMLVKHRHPTIDEERYCAYYLYLDFYDWLPRHGSILENKGRLNCNSMEQLWLAFVMKEKYNKVWNGEEWGIIF